MLCMLNIAIILGPFAIENLSQSFNLKKTNKKKLEKTTRKQTSKQNAGSMVITS